MIRLPLAVGGLLAATTGAQQLVTDAATRLANHRRHLEMRGASPHAKLRWRHIGPQQMSGRVTDVAVPSGRDHTIYVASASGGVWKTENRGTTWQPIFDDAPSASVGAIATAPSAPEHVWVGLGEANILRSSMAGTGVYRSTDGGASWRHCGLADTHHIARIVVHPTDPDVAYVAASGKEWVDNPERGVYRTRDGGETWQKVLFVSDRVGAIDLVVHPENPQVLYASMWNRVRRKWSDPKPGPDDGVFQSTDGGSTWQRLGNGLPPAATTGRIGLSIARSQPDTVYALVDNHAIKRKARANERDSYGRPRRDVIFGAEVYRSDDAGRSWRKVSEASRAMERLFSTYGWVFGQIRVDPNDPETSYVLGVPLLKSTDGGKTYDSLRYPGLHGDHHALWIDPDDSRHLVNGNDGGVNTSYDGGKTWIDFENLPVVQFYNVTYDWADPFRVYGSIQDNNSWRGPVTHRPGRDPDSQWERIPGGEASYHAVDPEDPNTLYSESFYGRIQRSTLEPRKTTNITPEAADGEPPLRGQWLAPFILSPHNSRIVYHGMQAVFRSLDRGDTWQRISPDLSHDDPERRGDISFQTITTLSESPQRFGLVYAGTDDGRLHVTPDGGLQWREITAGLIAGKWLSRVVASRWAEDRVYATQNGKRDCEFGAHVFVSEDRGGTWRSIAKGIPGGPVNVIAEDPVDADVLYVGTDLGVYVSTDRGGSWHVLGSGLPIAFVHDLVVHPRDPVMVVATHGRGMWRLDVDGVRQREGR